MLKLKTLDTTQKSGDIQSGSVLKYGSEGTRTSL